MNLLRLFNVISMCLATDTSKRIDIQKKNLNPANGYHCTDFWRTFDDLWLSNEHRTICFLSHISNNWASTKNLQKSLTSSVICRESPKGFPNMHMAPYFPKYRGSQIEFVSGRIWGEDVINMAMSSWHLLLTNSVRKFWLLNCLTCFWPAVKLWVLIKHAFSLLK